MAATDGTPPATPAASDTASNMQVVVYVRPLLRSEIASGCKDSAWGVSGGEMWQQKASRSRSAPPSHPPYRFDRIYGPDEGVAALHSEKVSRIVQQAMGGYHGAVLAYGQTASGKTTMVRGSVGVRDEGLITRCVEQLLTAFAADEEPSRYSLHLSYLEVYNEVRAHMLTPSLTRHCSHGSIRTALSLSHMAPLSVLTLHACALDAGGGRLAHGNERLEPV